ncbi:MAG: DUF3309 domain-containing protein [Verrucomicrobiae bacterium]|nr:DUF3309 domain-containing protein [Verrucomicrobiae bacterium]
MLWVVCILVLLILFLVGAMPTWPYSRQWGYLPSGLFTLFMVILIVLMAIGRL